jgi:hypothetical protein
MNWAASAAAIVDLSRSADAERLEASYALITALGKLVMLLIAPLPTLAR